MKVEQLMTKEVAACSLDHMLNEAAQIMWDHDCGFVPITDGTTSQRVVGCVTDRDLCMAAYTRGQTLGQIRIGDVMSTEVCTCKPGDEIAVAEATMREKQIHRLPVVDDADHLLGVISLADLAREATRHAKPRSQDLTAGKIGETLGAIRQPRVSATPS